MVTGPRGADTDSATVGATAAGEGAGTLCLATAWCPEPPETPRTPHIRADSLVLSRGPPHPSLPTPLKTHLSLTASDALCFLIFTTLCQGSLWDTYSRHDSGRGAPGIGWVGLGCGLTSHSAQDALMSVLWDGGFRS